MRLKPKRLFFDIETSPNIGFFWTAGYKQNIDYHNIIKEREIICICYKWEGERKIHSIQWDKNKSDRKLLIEFISVLKNADEIVGHNGDKFDLAWIRTRCFFHDIEMFPDYKSIDTLKIARSKFRFNSNRLDYISKFMGVGGKNKTDFDLWKRIVLDGCDSSMSRMIAYCKKDVVILEKVFEMLNKHVESKVHHGVLMGKGKRTCPNCGSHKLYRRTVRTTKMGALRELCKCEDCNKYATLPFEKKVTE